MGDRYHRCLKRKRKRLYFMLEISQKRKIMFLPHIQDIFSRRHDCLTVSSAYGYPGAENARFNPTQSQNTRL